MEWWGLLRFRNLLYLMCCVLIGLMIRYWREREEKRKRVWVTSLISMHFGIWKWQMWLNMGSSSNTFIRVQEAYKSDEMIFFFEDNIVFKLCWVRPYQKMWDGISFTVPDFEHTSLFPVPPLYVCLCHLTRVSGPATSWKYNIGIKVLWFHFHQYSCIDLPFLCPI